MEDSKSTLVIEMPQELYEKIKAEAARQYVPMSAFIRQLAVLYFDKQSHK